MRNKISPRIGEDEYDAFSAFMDEDDGFPDSYGEWRKHITKFDAHAVSQGFVITEIVIHPEEFADWCRRSGVDAGFHTLLGFTVAKAKKET